MPNEVEFFTVGVGEPTALPFFPEGIRAGFPSPATDYEEEAIDLNRELIAHREATFYARVKGESMIDAGIMPGDQLVVDRAIEHSTEISSWRSWAARKTDSPSRNSTSQRKKRARCGSCLTTRTTSAYE